MNLVAGYTPDIIYFTSCDSSSSDGAYELGHSGIVVDKPKDSYKPVSLEIMYFREYYMPLGTNADYSPETDTLVFGDGKDRATHVEENGDLVAYWYPDTGPDDLDLVAVALRNASKYVASAMDASA